MCACVCVCVYIYIYIYIERERERERDGLVTKSHHTLMTPWTVGPQAPLSMGFPREKYWSGLPFHSPGALPNPGIQPTSPRLAGRFFTAEPPGKPIPLSNSTTSLIIFNLCCCLYDPEYAYIHI